MLDDLMGILAVPDYAQRLLLMAAWCAAHPALAAGLVRRSYRVFN
jgi:hypothetical protein